MIQVPSPTSAVVLEMSLATARASSFTLRDLQVLSIKLLGESITSDMCKRSPSKNKRVCWKYK